MDKPIFYDAESVETCLVMLERKSLQNLINISESSLHSEVHTIQICTHHLSRQYYNDYVREPNVNIYDDTFYESRLLQQEDFIPSCLGYLTRAMTRLPNCNKICFSDADPPWGLKRVEDEVGFPLCRHFDLDSRDSRVFVKRALRITLASVSASRIQVTEIDISLGLTDRQMGNCSITSDALYFPAIDQQLIYQSSTNIKTLRLVLNTGGNEDWDDDLSSFLGLFPNLSHFRLHLADRGSSVEFSYLTEALQKLPLEVFELVNCSTTRANLMPLLLCHQATAENQARLKQIILEGVNIESGKNGTWSWVKEHLQTKLPLCSLDLRNCQVEGEVCMPPKTSWRQI